MGVTKLQEHCETDPGIASFLDFLEARIDTYTADLVPADSEQLRRIAELVKDVAVG